MPPVTVSAPGAAGDGIGARAAVEACRPLPADERVVAAAAGRSLDVGSDGVALAGLAAVVLAVSVTVTAAVRPE